MKSSFRERLPDLLIEAALVFFAVLIALAAEEWREDRERDELADRALLGILHEMGDNHDEIEQDQATNREQLDQMAAALDAVDGGRALDDLSINYQVALTSSAAWETARMSQAVHFLDFEIMSSLASVYEIQSLFERSQDDVMDAISNLGVRMRQDESVALDEIRSKIGSVMGYRDILLQTNAAALERYGAGEPLTP